MTEQLRTTPEEPVKNPFDFSEFRDPAPETESESGQTEKAMADNPAFDFSEFRDADEPKKTPEEAYDEMREASRIANTFDFSDEHIASGADVVRPRTPQEIYELGKADRQAEIDSAKLKNRLKKVGRGLVGAARNLR